MVSDNNERINELRKSVSKGAGAEECGELAALLVEEQETRAEAREVCFRAITQDARNLRARLILAKSFYLDEMPEFCVRELLEIQRLQHSPALERLIEAFGDFSKQFSTPSGAPAEQPASAEAEAPASDEELVMGEIELDADFDDAEEELQS